jgi:nicotinamidase-related amidase
MEGTCVEIRRALIIIDVQNEFLSANGNFPISDSCKPDLVANLTTLIPRFRNGGGHIIWVKALYENRTEEPSVMKEYPRGDGILGSNEWLTSATHVHPTPCCKAGSSGAEIYPDFLNLAAPEDKVITKGCYSAFNGSSELLQTLREKKVTNIYFCGVASGTCVLASVIDAVKLGEWQVHVLQDCMGWRRYNTHEEAIRRYEELKVDVVNCDQVQVTPSQP